MRDSEKFSVVRCSPIRLVRYGCFAHRSRCCRRRRGRSSHARSLQSTVQTEAATSSTAGATTTTNTARNSRRQRRGHSLAVFTAILILVPDTHTSTPSSEHHDNHEADVLERRNAHNGEVAHLARRRLPQRARLFAEPTRRGTAEEQRLPSRRR